MSSVLTKQEQANDLAREAVKNFRALLPMLNGYAQVLTGNKKVRVVLSSQPPSTDGERIFYRPPTELGRKYPHDRFLCDKRDPVTGLQRCAACAQREVILGSIFHEIAHIAYGSMVPTSDYAKTKFLRKAATVGNVEAIKRRVDSLPPEFAFKWPALASAVSPYFHLLLNAMEDVRVNQRMFAARRGTIPMFEAQERQIMEQGFEHKDLATGEIVTKIWRDAPLDSQVTVGVYLLGVGILRDSDLHESVIAALKDLDLKRMIEDIRGLRSAEGTVNLAFKVLVRLRELGFLLEPEERPEPESESDPEPEPSETEEPDTSESDTSDESADQADDSEGDDDDEGVAGESPEEDEGAGLQDDSADGSNDSSDGDDTAEPESGDAGESDDGQSSDRPGSAADDAGSGDSSDDESDSDEADDDQSGGQSDGSESGADGDDTGDTGGSSSDVEVDDGDGDADREDVSADRMADDAGEDQGTGDSIDSDPEKGELSDDAEPDTNSESGSEDSDRRSDDGTDSESTGSKSDGNTGCDTDQSNPDGPESSEVGNDDSSEGTEFGDSTDSSTGSASNATPEFGTPEEAAEALEQALGHVRHLSGDGPSDDGGFDPYTDKLIQDAVRVAIEQSEYFDKPSTGVEGVAFAAWDADGWRTPGRDEVRLRSLFIDDSPVGQPGDFMPAERILGPALLHLRKAFTDNAKGGKQANLRSGKVNTRALGSRAWQNDDRLFKKNTKVQTKAYKVIIGLDISGSTNASVGSDDYWDEGVGEKRIDLIKRAAMAQAELLHRLRIPFAIYAHSGQSANGGYFLTGMMSVAIFPIKEAHQPWDEAAKQRLAELPPYAVNLDGHTMQYYRKQLDKMTKRDEQGMLLYYTDGAMPCENFEEELDVLQSEIVTCKNRGHILTCVGVETDAPADHGLDTVRVDSDADLIKVVRHLENRILRG